MLASPGKPMAKVVIRIPRVKWRDGRPRFEPGPVLRALKIKGEDLRHPDGRWFTIEEAAAWAEAKQTEIAQIRKAAAEGRRVKPRGKAAVYTLEDLFEDLWKAPKITGGKKGRRKPLAASTLRDYKNKARALADFDPELYTSAVAAIRRPLLIALHERLWDAKGHHMANGIMAVLRLALTYATDKGKIDVNPALRLRLVTPEPRLRVGTIHEMEQLLRTADAIGKPMVGHAIMLGLMTAQRQGDRLALLDAGAREGRHQFRQSKTGTVVEVPETPHLVARMAVARAWREEHGIKVANVIVDPETGLPYEGAAYRNDFRLVRKWAVIGVPRAAGCPACEQYMRKGLLPNLSGKGRDGSDREINGWRLCTCADGWEVEPTPSLADFRDQDLRDTAVTWLARAGCTVPEICSITGHSQQSAYQILKHYLAIDRHLANSAIDKMVTYLEAEGFGA